jgi:hypothetical protein
MTAGIISIIAGFVGIFIATLVKEVGEVRLLQNGVEMKKTIII